MRGVSSASALRYHASMPASRYKYFDPQDAARLGNLGFVARRPVEGSVGGLHRSPHRGFSVEFADHREYVPGDDLRYLDWSAWGRTDRYYIKRYEQETNLRTTILLDSSGSMSYAGNGTTKFEYACRLTSLLAYMLVRQLDKVGLITFDDQPRITIPPSATSQHLDRIFTQLENIKPAGKTRLSRSLHRVAEKLGRRGLLVLISDLYDDPSDVLKALRHIQHYRHQIIVLHVLDPAELSLPFDRVTTFVDHETKQRIQIDPKVVRHEYRRQIEKFIAAYRRGCGELSIDYRLASTGERFTDVLREFLATVAGHK